MQKFDKVIFFADTYKAMDFNRRVKKRKLKEMFDSSKPVDFDSNLNQPAVPDENV